MQIEAIGLAVFLIPIELEPLEAFINGLERGLGVALDVGVVDSEDHGPTMAAGIQPVENKGASTADVEKSGGGRSKTNAKHEQGQYRHSATGNVRAA